MPLQSLAQGIKAYIYPNFCTILMFEKLKAYKIQFLFTISILVMYGAFAYDLQRHDFIKLITLYAALFFLSFKLIQLLKTDFKILVAVGVLARLVFFSAEPNLSQDFYRFIWDGRLLAQGLSPYLLTPDQWVAQGNIPINQSTELLEGMGSLSRAHYSNYPPVNQFFFWLAGLFSANSILGGIVVLRLSIIAADLGIVWVGSKLLKAMGLPVQQIFWYFLNPFILIELTGNLHFEGVMLFFMLTALYLLYLKKWFWAAVFWGLSVSVKLVPLMLLPLLFQFLIKPAKPSVQTQDFWRYVKQHLPTTLWKSVRFYGVAILVFILSFLPFLNSALLEHFSATLALWFQKFEFNASVYYVVRWVGYQVKGYNIIETAGKILPLIAVVALLALSFFRKNRSPQQLFTGLLFGISCYFALSTTVHPWYLATPLLLSVFTRYRYMLVWTFTIIFSYAAYQETAVEERLWMVALEYLILIGFMTWKFMQKVRSN